MVITVRGDCHKKPLLSPLSIYSFHFLPCYLFTCMSSRASTNIPRSLRKIWEQQEEHGRTSNPVLTQHINNNMATARAIVSRDTHANGGWKMEDVSVRKLEAGELLVDIVGSGICHTDALIGGLPAGAAPIAFYPRVLGHEGEFPVRPTSFLSSANLAQAADMSRRWARA